MTGELTGLINTATTMGSSIYNLLIWIILIGCLVGVGIFIYWIKTFKHKVIIRMVTKNGKFIIVDKAKPLMVDGTPIWRLFKMKKDVKPPPPEATEITKKGKFFAECYWTEDSPSPAWLEDKGTPDDAFSKQAFTATDRAFYTARHKKALERKTINMWNKISQIIMPVTIIVIIMIPFIFWGDITKSANDTMSVIQATSRDNAKISEQNARILSVLAGKLESGDINVVQDIKPPDINESETK